MNGPSFTFTMSFTPILSANMTNWQFPLVNWNLSSTLLTLIDDLFPLGPFIFAGAIDAAVDGFVANGLAPISSLGVGGLNGSTPFPNSSTWNINYNLLGLVVCPPPNPPDPTWAGTELDAYVAVSVTGPASNVPAVPQLSLSADDSHSLSNELPIFVSLAVTNGAGLFAPALGLRIQWTATRNDYGVQVLDQDTAFTSANLAINVQRAGGPAGDLIYNDTWTVTCKVYRPADALTPEFLYFNSSIQVGLADFVDRHKPYIRWKHEVFIHDPHGLGPLKWHHFWTRNRTARVHRTDLFIRCSMLARALNKEMTPPLEYLDSIAEYGTLEELTNPHLVSRKSHRKELCDFCFFGGPTRNVWKTPTAPTPDWV